MLPGIQRCALPGSSGRRRGGRSGKAAALPGTRRQPGSGAASGANSSSRQSAGGGGRDSAQGAAPASALAGVAGPRRGRGAQDLPSRDPGRAGRARSLAFAPGARLLALGEGGPAGITVTSPPFTALIRRPRRSRSGSSFHMVEGMIKEQQVAKSGFIHWTLDCFLLSSAGQEPQGEGEWALILGEPVTLLRVQGHFDHWN
ncbi:uncharacterized protein LOC106145221 [Ictidomys tridecemlineatus]